MIVKDVVGICKKRKSFCFYETDEGQWLSDGVGVYPLFGIPRLNADTVCAMYAISETTKAKTSFMHKEALPSAYDFNDVVENEKECEPIPIGVSAFGCHLRPYRCSDGAVYFDEKYFKPLKDYNPEMLKVFERISTSGASYYVVKEGMCLVALIMPVRAVTEEMVGQLQCLARLTKLALENRELRDEVAAESTPEEVGE